MTRIDLTFVCFILHTSLLLRLFISLSSFIPRQRPVAPTLIPSLTKVLIRIDSRVAHLAKPITPIQKVQRNHKTPLHSSPNSMSPSLSLPPFRKRSFLFILYGIDTKKTRHQTRLNLPKTCRSLHWPAVQPVLRNDLLLKVAARARRLAPQR